MDNDNSCCKGTSIFTEFAVQSLLLKVCLCHFKVVYLPSLFPSSEESELFSPKTLERILVHSAPNMRRT